MENLTNELFVAEGDEAKKQSEESSQPGAKANYLKLGAGQSVRVILLDAKFPNYYCHGDFALKIPSHVCTAPRSGMACKSCDANIKRSKKYLVPFYDIDKKEIVVWDTSKKHVSCVYSAIDNYGDDVTEQVFTLKRTGSSAQDTSYSLMPLPPKQMATVEMPTDVKAMESGSQERSDFYNNILRVPSDEYLDKIIKGASTEAAPVVNNGNTNGF